MNNKSFLYSFFGLASVSFLFIGTLNFIVDPGNIYWNKILADRQASKYSSFLFSSKYGILHKNISERQLKVELAKSSSQFDCVVIGSSRIMEVSSIRNYKLVDGCFNILNLGVSGASIEDLSIFTYLVLNNIHRPKKVILNIDIFTLKFGMDARWQENKKIYDDFIKSLKINSHEYISYEQKLLENILNYSYTIASVKKIIKLNKSSEDNQSSKSNIALELAKKFDYNLGYRYEDFSVYLQDGSRVYSYAQHRRFDAIIEQIKGKNIDRDEATYKVGGEVYEEKALKLLVKIIELYKYNGIKVELHLAPYNPALFETKYLKTLHHIEIMEVLVKKIAKDNNISLLGSYYPENVGCGIDEFHDLMHLKKSCQDKIKEFLPENYTTPRKQNNI